MRGEVSIMAETEPDAAHSPTKRNPAIRGPDRVWRFGREYLCRMGRGMAAIRLTSVVLGFLFAATAPAQATPGAWFTVSEDHLIGTTDTHFYVIRDITDERYGTYYAKGFERYLVEIAFDTHRASRHWLLRRTTVHTLVEQKMLEDDWRSDPANPPDAFAILREAGAVPPLWWGEEFSAPWYGMQPEGIGGGGETDLTWAELQDIALAMHAPVAADYAAHPDVLEELSQLSLAEGGCEMDRDRFALDMNSDTHVGLIVRCALRDDEPFWSASFYVFLPMTDAE